MKKIISFILSLSLFISTASGITFPVISFASNEIPDVEYISESEPTIHTETPTSVYLDLEELEKQDDEPIVNTRENKAETRASLINTNKTLWEELMSSQFGDDYFNPYRNKSTQEVCENTNKLRMVETDLSLPGKNGLDLNIRRKYDNQRYSNYYVCEKSDTYPTEHSYVYTIYVYRFNRSDGGCVDVSFHSPEEFYIYMYDGYCVSDLNVAPDFTTEDNVQGLKYETIMKKKSSTGITLTYDSSVEMRMIEQKETTNYDMIDVSLNAKHTSINNGWYYDLPHSYALLDETEPEKTGDVKRKINSYSGVFVDIEGVVHSYSAAYTLKFYVSNGQVISFTSSVVSDNSDMVYYTRYYEEQELDDGTKYNFIAIDHRKQLTYYMHDSLAGAMSRRQTLKIMQVRNDYGDKIQYIYPPATEQNPQPTLPEKIIDTYGREISISRAGLSYCLTPGDTPKTIQYNFSGLSKDAINNNSLLKAKPINVFTVINEVGEETTYYSRQTDVLSIFYGATQFNVGRPSGLYNCPKERAYGYNIEMIVYPTGLEKHYEYVDIYVALNQGKTQRQMYGVSAEYEKAGDEIINKNTYTMTDDSYRYIIGTREADGRVITKFFDQKGRLVYNRVTNKNSSFILSGYDLGYDTYDNITRYIKYTDGVGECYDYSYIRRSLPFSFTHGYEQLTYSYYGDTDVPYMIESYDQKTRQYKYYIQNTFLPDHLKISNSKVINLNGTIFSNAEYQYDGEGNLVSEKRWVNDTDKNNRVSDGDHFEVFNRATSVGEDLLVSVVDSATDVYDANGENTGNVSAEYKYNIYGSPVQRKDGYGNITYVYYDGLNRPVEFVYPDSTRKTIDYSAQDKRIIVTDRDGVKYKYIYNALGLESGKYVFHDQSWKPLYTKEYDTVGGRLIKLVEYSSEDKGTITTYTYDVADRPITETVKSFEPGKEPQELYSTAYTYSGGSGSYRLKTSVMSHDGVTTTTTDQLNAMGWLVSRTVADGTNSYVTSYIYDYQGKPLTVTDANNNSISNTYDDLGNLISVNYRYGNVAKYSYDFVGRQISATDANGNVSHMYYDSLDRLIKTETPFDATSSAVAKTFYDKNSRVVKESVKSNKSGEAESYTTKEYMYDSMDNLTAVILQDDNENNVVRYNYTPSGKLSEMITGLNSPEQNANDGAKTTYEYNAFGQLIKTTDALGQSEQYAYDYLGNPLTYVDKNGSITENSYGVFGLEFSQVQNGDNIQTVENTYDSIGNIIGISSYKNNANESTINYTFDAFNRLISENDGLTTKNYTYDKVSNLASYKLIQNGEIKDSITYTYDSLNRLTGIDNGDIITSYSYDNNSNIISKSSGGFTTDYTYNSANMITGLTNKYAGNVLSGYTYEYSLDGNKVAENSTDGSAKTYSYDGIGRLIGEVHNNGNSQNVYSYAYDRFGNRSSKTVNGEVSTYEYDLNNRLIAVHSGNAGTYYNYDNNGNQILSRSFELTDGQESKVSGITDYSDYKIYDYDLFNRLVNYNNGEEDSCSYTYHSDGLRKSKTINGATTSYSWNNGNLALETDASETTIYEYDLQGVSRRIKNGSSDYYVKNAHGDVTGLYNRSGAAVNTYDYDAFGNHLTNNETDINPFRYCGEYFDAETNNIYLRNRYYDTASGRFITEDPIKDGLNWYVYCGNNPIAFVDPLGLVVTKWDRTHLPKNELDKIIENDNTWNSGTDDQKQAAKESSYEIRSSYLLPNQRLLDNGYVEETITSYVDGKTSNSVVSAYTDVTIIRTYMEKYAFVRLDKVLVKIETNSGFIVDSLNVSSGQSAPRSSKKVEISTSNKKRYSFSPKWGNVFDDGGVGNTVIGTHVQVFVRRPNSDKLYNLTITNQLYETEVVDEKGQIIKQMDMSSVLEEALQRGERE